MNEETVLTMVLAGGRGERLAPLTRRRAKPALRFGGVYRIIDFTLSNCLNSGLRRVYLLTQFASTSLDRHVHAAWAPLFRHDLGELLECRPPQQYSGREWYTGTADSIYKNRDLIADGDGDDVLVLSGDHVYTMDYRPLLDLHRRSGASATVSCVEMPAVDASSFGVLAVRDDGVVTGFVEKPAQPRGYLTADGTVLVSMGVYCFDRRCLLDVLEEDEADEASGHDFGHDVIPRLLREEIPIAAAPFVDQNRKETPYWRDIGTLDAYWEASMDLVAVDPLFNLYNHAWPIRCWLPPLPPAKTVFDWPGEGRVGSALDSLLSPGVIVSGARVERSILSPLARVNSHARVRESILFDGVTVGRHATVERAIVDGGVTIPVGARVEPGAEVEGLEITTTDKGVCAVTRR